VAAGFALAAIALGYVAYRHVTEAPPQVLRFTVPPPEKGTFSANGLPAVSPDGRRVAYIAIVEGKNELWLRDLDSLAARPLVTENSRSPFWSPDGRSIGFFSGGKLKKMDVSGGPALTVCDALDAIDATWSRNDVILFSAVSSILRVAAAGGNPTTVTTLDKGSGEVFYLHPWFLPDGRRFLYTAFSTNQEKTAIYVGDLESKQRRRVMFAQSNAVYTPPDYLLFLRERTLMAQPFDAGKLQTTGDASPIVEQVDSQPGRATGQFSVSQNGVLA
jgi:Tol biopolymer transport system component